MAYSSGRDAPAKSYPKRWGGGDTGIKVLGWYASAISLRGVHMRCPDLFIYRLCGGEG
jgi:hypothetical protein